MKVRSENKFTGYEIIDGINCAKFTSVISGTRDMSTMDQGMDVKTKGSFTGTGELYFATSSGYFIKHKVVTRMTGNLEISAPDVTLIPVVMDITMVNEVQK